MPAFLHWYPGLTPETYWELAEDDWELMRSWLESARKGVKRAPAGP